MNTWEDKSITT